MTFEIFVTPKNCSFPQWGQFMSFLRLFLNVTVLWPVCGSKNPIAKDNYEREKFLLHPSHKKDPLRKPRNLTEWMNFLEAFKY